MNQNEIRAQRQREQDERRLSLQRNNAYFSFVSPQTEKNPEIPANVDQVSTRNTTRELMPIADDNARSGSPSLSSTTNKLQSEECTLTLPHATSHQVYTPVDLANEPNPTATPTATVPTARQRTTTPKIADPATNTKTVTTQPTTSIGTRSTVQTGMERYITFKRKLSPQNSTKGSRTKINRSNPTNETPNNTNRFEILADNCDELPPEAAESDKKKPKPPPIYIREKSSSALVNKIIELIGKDNFHIIPLIRGNIHETKVQIKTEENYRVLSKYLNDSKRNFYTYQLKSSKGLQVVLKGIESDVTPAEIIQALKEKGFTAKTVINILNRNRKPQPLFRVELEPETKPLNKNEVHPIYKLQFLLHRRITVEEPHKRTGPVQCTNCQEFGHTKSYCTLRSVCVACGELHESATCTSNKDNPNEKRCGNCGGNHTANYRGCPVYKELKSRIHQRVTSARSQNAPSKFILSKTNPEVFFSTAVRSSFGSATNTKKVTYANALKSGLTSHTTPIPQAAQTDPYTAQNHQTVDQPQSNIEVMLCTLQQSMLDFMSFMRTTMQDLMRNQNMLIQMLVSQQSK